MSDHDHTQNEQQEEHTPYTEEEMNNNQGTTDNKEEAGTNDEGGAPQAEEDELTRVKRELEEMKNVAARAQADLHNAKKRMEQDKAEFMKFANTNFVTAVLPVIDNLDRAITYLPAEQKESDLGKGVEAVVAQFVKVLEGFGVTRIPALQGSTYNPNLHEAVLQAPGKQDEIIDILEHGYELHGRVLRPTKVKVGDGSL